MDPRLRGLWAPLLEANKWKDGLDDMRYFSDRCRNNRNQKVPPVNVKES
jgi:hypothetical protein